VRAGALNNWLSCAVGWSAKGCSLAEIVEKLDVSKAAASSLVGDLHRKGISVKLENGVYKI
jgi:DNA-binding IclR family transcriptional regulator